MGSQIHTSTLPIRPLHIPCLPQFSRACLLDSQLVTVMFEHSKSSQPKTSAQSRAVQRFISKAVTINTFLSRPFSSVAPTGHGHNALKGRNAPCRKPITEAVFPPNLSVAPRLRSDVVNEITRSEVTVDDEACLLFHFPSVYT